MTERQTSCADCNNDIYIDDVGCIDGTIYGYCDSAMCGGACEPIDYCGCECHWQFHNAAPPRRAP